MRLKSWHFSNGSGKRKSKAVKRKGHPLGINFGHSLIPNAKLRTIGAGYHEMNNSSLELTLVSVMLKLDSHLVICVVRFMQKDLKDKDSEVEYSVFWVFLQNINDPNELV